MLRSKNVEKVVSRGRVDLWWHWHHSRYQEHPDARDLYISTQLN